MGTKRRFSELRRGHPPRHLPYLAYREYHRLKDVMTRWFNVIVDRYLVPPMQLGTAKPNSYGTD
jgi:hypothetical protein